MFNINSFYFTIVLKMHYRFFFQEHNINKNRKTYFVPRGSNETKCKSNPKYKQNLI